MKINKTLIFSILLLVAFVFVFVFSGCSTKIDTANYNEVNLYFANSQKNDLTAEKRFVKKNDNENKYLENVVDALLNGPTNSALSSIIPEKTRLLDIEKDGTEVTVNLSAHYLSDGKTDNILARYSIANTLFEISGINHIKIFVDGTELKNSSGEPIGTISKKNVINGVSDTNQQTEKITVYFSDDTSMNLVPEIRYVQLVENSIEKAIINELISGPEKSGLLPVIPQETKLISVETKEGICFVNFSQEFVTKHPGGSWAEAMTVYSIVNSLTELDTVDKVQFMVEGNKIDVYKHLEFNEPFKRDDTLIKE